MLLSEYLREYVGKNRGKPEYPIPFSLSFSLSEFAAPTCPTRLDLAPTQLHHNPDLILRKRPSLFQSGSISTDIPQPWPAKSSGRMLDYEQEGLQTFVILSP